MSTINQIPLTEPSPREWRRRELWRWNKGDLVVWLKNQPGFVGSAPPLPRWNKTDLINSILEIEYPGMTRPLTPATAEPPPVPQADGHPDPLHPVAGPGEPETAGAR